MDQVLHQNATLVEQMASAASSLKSQPNELLGAMVVRWLRPALRGASVLRDAKRAPARSLCRVVR